MSSVEMRLNVKVSWWVKAYIRIVAIWCVLTRTAPNVERTTAVIMRGVKVEGPK